MIVKNHYPDCTYCKHRGDQLQMHRFSKAKIGQIKVEWCLLHDRAIPTPEQRGRWCKNYARENCDCEKCNS